MREECDLPVGWGRAILSDLIAPDGEFSDGDWVESKDQDPNGNIRLLQLADIGDAKFLDKSARFVNEVKFTELRCTEVLENDVLIARMPDPLGRACQVPSLQQKAITVVDIAIVRPGINSVDPRWLMHAINSPVMRETIAIQSTGTTRRRIARGKLADLPFPLPPCNEQKRIAAKLDTTLAAVDACRQRLDGVAAILKRFRQAVLAAATSGELTREWREERGEPSWDTKALGECGAVTGGVTKNSRRNDMTLQKPYLRVANVYRNRLELDDIAVIGVTDSEYLKTVLRAGDLLIVEGNGSLQQVGRVAIWQDESLDCVHQNHLIRWRTYEMEPKWALYWLMSPVGRELLEERAQTSTGLHTLSVSKISGIPIAYPSLSEQKQVIHLVGVLFTLADQLEAKLSAARKSVDRLTPALLAKAFRGELVPQDPNDEPAIELLQRIRAARQAEAAAGKPPRRGRMKAAPYPDQPPLDAAPVAPDLLSGLLQECGALSERALLAASELAPGRFRMQLQTELESGMIYEELAQGERVLVAVNSYPKQHYSCKTY